MQAGSQLALAPSEYPIIVREGVWKLQSECLRHEIGRKKQ
jgi:hypothetical protein